MCRDENSILEKIRESARKAPVPHALEPEQIRDALKKQQGKTDAGIVENRWNIRSLCGQRAYLAARFAAAALVFAVSAGTFGYALCVQPQRAEDGQDNAVQKDAAGSYGQDNTVKKDVSENAAHKDSEKQADAAENDAQAAEPDLKKIGKMYTLASGYGEIYDRVAKVQEKYLRATQTQKETAEKNIAEDSVQSGTSGYSTTNLQVAGVDESDVVKTDGSYLYAVSENTVQIFALDGRLPRVAAQIQPQMGAADQICELYVSDGRLVIILQTEETELTSEAGGQLLQELSAEKQACADVAYSMDNTYTTKALTYDISAPSAPKLMGTFEQDGRYQTSRRIGDVLYLFTEYMMQLPETEKEQAAVETESARWMPCVQGEAVSYDSVYLGKNSAGGLLCSSVKLSEPKKCMDTKLVLDTAQVYVSNGMFCLYRAAAGSRTELARFTLNDGLIRAKAATRIRGTVEDLFAISEEDGFLRVLTTEWQDAGTQNRLYVLDEDMKAVGTISHIADGETIYSARFIGQTGYFVTYRNMDPLFTVDVSDPYEPKITGELALTGFSEYLHVWDENHLLGIGYESDPETGELLGVKLSMFDISNPAHVVEEAKTVLADADGSSALYDYKAVLADAKKNILAFTTESYEEQGTRTKYQVFSYENGGFVNRLCEQTAYGYICETGRCRSLYVENKLYFVEDNRLTVYDTERKYRKLGEISL